jgi:hypothetical protein
MRWKNSEFWKHASPKELIDFFKNMHTDESLNHWVSFMDEDSSFAELVFEYLWLCRNDETVINLLNHPKVSPTLILHFIYFGFGKYMLSGQIDSADYFIQVKQMFNSEQSLRILSMAMEMENDPTLKIHLLSNLNPQTWESYFDMLEQNSQNMQTLLEIFSNLREKEIRKILLNSPTLYYYLRMMIFSVQESKDEVSVTKADIRNIIDSIHIWEKFCLSITSQYSLEEERKKPPNKRDGNRISHIIRELIAIPKEDRGDILVYMKRSGALIDEEEESMIQSLLQNYDMHGKIF